MQKSGFRTCLFFLPPAVPEYFKLCLTLLVLTLLLKMLIELHFTPSVDTTLGIQSCKNVDNK